MSDDPLYSMLGFTDAEWGLLVGLPQSVLTAASAATASANRASRLAASARIPACSASSTARPTAISDGNAPSGLAA